MSSPMSFKSLALKPICRAMALTSAGSFLEPLGPPPKSPGRAAWRRASFMAFVITSGCVGCPAGMGLLGFGCPQDAWARLAARSGAARWMGVRGCRRDRSRAFWLPAVSRSALDVSGASSRARGSRLVAPAVLRSGGKVCWAGWQGCFDGCKMLSKRVSQVLKMAHLALGVTGLDCTSQHHCRSHFCTDLQLQPHCNTTLFQGL